LKAEALDHNSWRTHFERGTEPVVRQYYWMHEHVLQIRAFSFMSKELHFALCYQHTSTKNFLNFNSMRFIFKNQLPT